MYNAQDFAQILYIAGGVCIINKNNVFHSFFRTGNHMSAIFGVYYCQHAKLNIFIFLNLFGHYSTKSLNTSNTF